MRFIFSFVLLFARCTFLFFVLLTLIYLSRDYAFPVYAKFFELDIDPPLSGYSIVVLGGNPAVRVPHAIELYEENLARNIMTPIIITEPMSHVPDSFRDVFTSEFDMVKRILDRKNIQYSVAASSGSGATSTYDEAVDLERFTKLNGITSILILTDSFHTRRAYMTFRNVFDIMNNSCNLYIRGSTNRVFDHTNWHKTELGLRTYMVETGTWIFHFVNRGKKLVSVDPY